MNALANIRPFLVGKKFAPLAIGLIAIGLLLNYFRTPLLAIGLVITLSVLALFLARPREMLLFFLFIRSSLDITKEYASVYLSASFQLTAPLVISFLLILGGVYYILAHRVPILRIPFARLSILFLLFSSLNLMMAEDVIASLMELTRFFSTFLVYVLAWNLFDSKREIRVLIATILYSALIPIAAGIYQAITNRGQLILEFLRVYGTFVHPNPFAFYLLIILSLSLNLYLDRPRPAVRWGLSLLSLSGILCLLFSFTRTAWFGFLLVLLFLAWFRDRRLFWLFAILVLVFSILSPIRSRFYDLATSFNSLVHRLDIWRGGLEKLPSFPLVGRGLASFEILDIYGEPAHNDYLRVLFELGLTGLAVYVVLIISVLGKLLLFARRPGDPLLFSLTCSTLAIFFIFQVCSVTSNILFRPAIQWYLWALIAAVLKTAEIDARETVKFSQEARSEYESL